MQTKTKTAPARLEFAAWLRPRLKSELGHDPLGSLRDTRVDCMDVELRYPLMLLAALEGEEARIRPLLADEDRALMPTLSAVAVSERWDALPKHFHQLFDEWSAHEATRAVLRMESCRLRRRAASSGASADWLAGATGLATANVSLWLAGDDDVLPLDALRAVSRALTRVPETQEISVRPTTAMEQASDLVDAESLTGGLGERGRDALGQVLSNVGTLASMASGTCAADDALEVLEALTRRMVMQAREAEAAGFDLSCVFDDVSHEPANQFGVGHAVMDYVCLDMVWGADRMASEGAECLRRRVESATPEEVSRYVDMSRDTPLARRCGRASEDVSAGQ